MSNPKNAIKMAKTTGYSKLKKRNHVHKNQIIFGAKKIKKNKINFNPQKLHIKFLLKKNKTYKYLEINISIILYYPQTRKKLY